MIVSRTTPTLWVLVIAIGPSRKPDSSIQIVPVISPLPLSANHPLNTGSEGSSQRGTITVTPVRTGPSPTRSSPSPRISVVCATRTPLTSVIAFRGPGDPSNGTPRSLARAPCCAITGPAAAIKKATSTAETQPKRNLWEFITSSLSSLVSTTVGSLIVGSLHEDRYWMPELYACGGEVSRVPSIRWCSLPP